MAEKYESNTIRMKNWNGYSICSILFLSLFFTFLPGLFNGAFAQNFQRSGNVIPEENGSFSTPSVAYKQHVQASTDTQEVEAVPPEFPDPQKVMLKSAIVPGWGQVINKQVWKVPLVYALIGGVTGYTIYLTKEYHGYRAAYYNAERGAETDYRFGETPDHIPADTNPSSLKDTRDQLRNRRDLMYLAIGLAYGLNVVDAYVFAHMRSFDVSEDLSMTIQPDVVGEKTAGLTVKLNLK